MLVRKSLIVIFLVMTLPGVLLSTSRTTAQGTPGLPVGDFPVITASNVANLREVARLGQGKLISVGWTPDGKALIAATSIGLWIYDAADLEKPPRLLAGPGAAMAVSPRGNLVAFGGGATVSLWNVASSQVAWTSQLPDSDGAVHVGSLAFSPDGATLAVGSVGDTGGIGLLDTTTGNLLKRIHPGAACLVLDPGDQSPFSSGVGDYGYLVFTPDGKFLVVGGRIIAHDDMEVGSVIGVWNLKTGEEKCVSDKKTVNDLLVSPDGKRILWSANTSIEEFALKDFKIVQDAVDDQLELESAGWISSVKFTPQDGSMLVGAGNGFIYHFDARGDNFRTLAGHLRGISSLAISPDGQRLASASGDGTVRVWDLKADRLLTVLTGYTGDLSAMQSSPDSQWIAEGSYDGGVRVWNVAGGQYRDFIKKGEGGARALVFSPDGKQLAWLVNTGDIADLLDQLYIWQVDDTNHLLSTFTGQYLTWGGALAFSPDSKLLASMNSSGGSIIVWNAHTGTVYSTLPGTGNSSSRMDFSPDSKSMAVSAGVNAVLNPNTIRVQDVAGKGPSRIVHIPPTARVYRDPATGLVASGDLFWWPDGQNKTFSSFTMDQGYPANVAFSPDAMSVAINDINSVSLWAVATGQQRVMLNSRYPLLLYRQTFSPDSQLLAAAGTDHTLRLYNAATGESLAVLNDDPGEEVQDLVFTPDQRFVVRSSADGVIRLWGVTKPSQ